MQCTFEGLQVVLVDGLYFCLGNNLWKVLNIRKYNKFLSAFSDLENDELTFLRWLHILSSQPSATGHSGIKTCKAQQKQINLKLACFYWSLNHQNTYF